MLFGRQSEKSRLLSAYESEYSEFGAVYGRHRVGKTFLIRETFNYRFTFQHSGDEVPWMDTHASGLIPALENFWNSWASTRKDVLLIMCGSATSWIINQIVKKNRFSVTPSNSNEYE